MNFDSNLPIYIQIMDYIKRQMIIGELKEGDKLESVREMATKLKVNPNTVQRSYGELEREGLVFTQRGMGTFVTEDKKEIDSLKKDIANNFMDTFIQDMKAIGFDKKEVKQLLESKIEEV